MTFQVFHDLYEPCVLKQRHKRTRKWPIITRLKPRAHNLIVKYEMASKTALLKSLTARSQHDRTYKNTMFKQATLIKKASDSKRLRCGPINPSPTHKFLYPCFNMSFFQMRMNVEGVWCLDRFGSNKHQALQRKA